MRAAVTPGGRNWVVIARTDDRPSKASRQPLSGPVVRTEAGADVTFVEAPETLEDLTAVPRRLKAPQLVNMVLGGKTPITDQKAAAKMGFSVVLYANAAPQGAVHGMQSTLSSLKEKGVLDERAVTSFAERQRLVDKQADLMWKPAATLRMRRARTDNDVCGRDHGEPVSLNVRSSRRRRALGANHISETQHA